MAEEEKLEVKAEPVNPDRLRMRLQPGDRNPDKIRNYSSMLKVAVVAIAAIFILSAVAMCSTPETVEGPAQACFKHEQCINLLFAKTSIQHELGLSGHESLDKDTGLLFVFNKPGVQRMWMKDMNFPIDIFWIGAKGKILEIVKNARPCNSEACEIFEPGVNAKYVLETNSGFAIEKNLYEGETVELLNLPR